MAIVYRDEITAAIGLNYPGLLGTDSEEANNMKSLLADFKGNTVLRGDIWNKSYEKMDVFSGALSKRSETAQTLSAAIESGLNKILTALKDYDMLDTSKIPELESELNAMIQRRDALLASASAAEDDGMLAMIMALVAELNAKIEKLKKFINDLKEMEATYNEVLGQLNTVMQDVVAFNSTVNGITPSPKYAYVKA